MMETVVERLMREKSITNKSLARILDVTDAVVCRWKRGQVCVSPGRRKQIAEALGVSVDDIFDNRGLAKLADGEALK